MRKAVVVGIDEYEDAPLRFCVSDATAVAETLELSQYGFEVERLLNCEANKRAIRDALNRMFASDAELLLFYFAGHGTATDLGGFLDTPGAEAPDDGLPLELLRKLAEVRLKNEHSLVYVLDCCHSGILKARRTGAVEASLRADDVRQQLTGMGGTGRVVLAACQEHEYAEESERFQHGVFTNYLLEGLCGYAADASGDVTAMSLYEYTSRKFHDKPSQKPVFSGDVAGRIVLGAGFTPIAAPALEVKQYVDAEAEADRLLRHFHTDLGEFRRDPDDWRARGFRAACTNLEALMRWFGTKTAKLPGLEERSQFRKSIRDLEQRRAELCQLTSGTVTVEGEAIEPLGHGNFGTVWRVKSVGDGGSEVAYKVFHPHDLGYKEKVSRFERGFHAMERLDHPRIVRVHRLTACPYGYFMDYIPGPNLRKFVGTFDQPADTLGLLITIAETLQHAHGREVIHRDLKPENVLLSIEVGRGWRAYLTDFDLAWFTTATQITKSALGSTYYASPEQIDKPGSASARAKTTDVYSFGQLMYFAFCEGDPPREGSLQALKARIRDGWSQEPARRLAELYTRCVEFSPAKRPSDFRGIAEELVATRALLLGRELGAAMDTEAFLKEVAFALGGLEAEVDVKQNTFMSLSGKIRVVTEIDEGEGERRIRFDLQCLEAPALPGASHQRMRELVLARVERAIHAYPGATKRQGNQLPFEVHLDFRVGLTQGGAMKAASLVGSAVDAIESLG
jgi:hypothetical protein